MHESFFGAHALRAEPTILPTRGAEEGGEERGVVSHIRLECVGAIRTMHPAGFLLILDSSLL